MDGSKLIAEMSGLSILSMESQHKRLLRLDFPRHNGPANAVLLVNAIEAVEELSRDFRFEVDLISDNAHIDPAAMMTKMATVSMVRIDGSLRYFNGYIAEFELVAADGGLAFYRMVLEPWLAFARLTEDCFSFHNRSVIELSEDTFADYLERDWNVRLIGQHPRLTCANQYNESDYNHLHRRWEAAGLYYWYEHRADGHTLWLSDHSMTAEPVDQIGDAPGEIRFRGQSGASEDDSVCEWRVVRRVKAGKTSLASFDYKNPSARVVSRPSLNRQGDVFAREVYHNTGYGFSTTDDGVVLADRTMDGIDADALQFCARGNERKAQPGRRFKLTEHFSCNPPPFVRSDEKRDPASSSSDYLIVRVTHSASNNYQAGKGAHSHYDNTFTCVRSATRWLPRLGYNSHPHPDPGVQTAVVVGLNKDEIYTDELGRVKVQFHWDRVGKFDVNSSPWIRVVMPLAGSTMGFQLPPRVKQEVAVLFMAGNIDHPIILGGDFNSLKRPSWRLPNERQLMGLRSCELSSLDGKSGGQRGNHLVLDDTNGKIQAQLKSDHQHSQLSLGHITRIEDTSGRKDFRGEGWELASDAWGVARAGKGMLITTEARPAAAQHIKSMDETVQRLDAAQHKHSALADVAVQQGAQESGQQTEVAAVIKAQNAAIKGAGDPSFPELAAPHLVLASPAGIETTTAQSTHIASAEHTAMTTGRNLSISTGDSFFASVRETFRLFVHKAGIKLIAAAGKVTIQAQADDIEVIANKVLTLISESDWIELRGKKGIRLHGAESMLEISDKVQFFTASPTLFQGNLETLGAQGIMQPTVGVCQKILAHTELAQLLGDPSWLEFRLVDTDAPMPDVRYVVTDPNGTKHHGYVDQKGFARIEQISPGSCTVEFPDLGYSISAATGLS